MRPYERSRILVEQCEDCRGIFLDQGELERLVEAEGGGWSGRIVQPSGSSADHEVVPRNAR
jgi:Zn-finger nucleic acid-binding protein